MIAEIADNSAPTEGADSPPSEGVAFERLHPSAQLAITALLPRERGRLFVTHLLSTAVVKTVDIPGLGLVEAAVLFLPSVEVFARAHGWGKDTALRYADIFEGLQFIHRFRHAHLSEFHIPLGAWKPSVSGLAALDTLIEGGREKVRQLARGVKERYTLLYGSPQTWSSLFTDLDGTLLDIQDQLAHRVSITKRTLLQIRITNLLERLNGAEGLVLQKGDFCGTPWYDKSNTVTQEGDFQSTPQATTTLLPTKRGDFSQSNPKRPISGVLDAAQKGDFQGQGMSLNRRAPVQKGDFRSAAGNDPVQYQAHRGDLQRSARTEKGDFSPSAGNDGAFSALKGDLGKAFAEDLAEKGDFHQRSATRLHQKGDFQGERHPLTINDNESSLVSKYIPEESDIVNDIAATPSSDGYAPAEAKRVGMDLALFFEKHDRNVGSFINKCKTRTRTNIRASVIDVLVHAYFPDADPAYHRGKQKNRAACFHSASNRYAEPGSVCPAYVQRWLDTDASWEYIEEVLQEASKHYKMYMLPGDKRAAVVRQWLCGEITQQALDQALQKSFSQEQGTYPERRTLEGQNQGIEQDTAAESETKTTKSPAKTWMNEDEAETLAQRIMCEAAEAHLDVSCAHVREDQHAYVVAIEAHGHTITFTYPDAWTSYFTGVQQNLQLQEQYKQQLARKGASRGTGQ